MRFYVKICLGGKTEKMQKAMERCKDACVALSTDNVKFEAKIVGEKNWAVLHYPRRIVDDVVPKISNNDHHIAQHCTKASGLKTDDPVWDYTVDEWMDYITRLYRCTPGTDGSVDDTGIAELATEYEQSYGKTSRATAAPKVKNPVSEPVAPSAVDANQANNSTTNKQALDDIAEALRRFENIVQSDLTTEEKQQYGEVWRSIHKIAAHYPAATEKKRELDEILAELNASK